MLCQAKGLVESMSSQLLLRRSRSETAGNRSTHATKGLAGLEAWKLQLTRPPLCAHALSPSRRSEKLKPTVRLHVQSATIVA